MLLLTLTGTLPQTELGALLAMSDEFENASERPPFTAPDMIIHYEEEDGIKYACAYWDYQKRRVPVEYHDEENLKVLLWEMCFDHDHMVTKIIRDNPPTVIAEEI